MRDLIYPIDVARDGIYDFFLIGGCAMPEEPTSSGSIYVHTWWFYQALSPSKGYFVHKERHFFVVAHQRENLGNAAWGSLEEHLRGIELALSRPAERRQWKGGHIFSGGEMVVSEVSPMMLRSAAEQAMPNYHFLWSRELKRGDEL